MTTTKEMTMTIQLSTEFSSQLSTKLAALAVALMVNGMMLGGVAYLFSAQLHEPTAVTALGATTSMHAVIPTI
jgi:hypothetical protein